MSDPDSVSNAGQLTGGISGKQAEPDALPMLVAPTTSGKGKNTLRLALIPVACWKLNDVRFEFGSSFILPSSRVEFLELIQLRRDHTGSPLSIFGHADPVGNDDGNKKLSGNRAEAVYAILIKDVRRWETLYKAAGSNEGWGQPCIKIMLDTLGFASVLAFQSANTLTEDGKAGPATREVLFRKYMDHLFPVTLAKSDFLGGGADSGGKGDFQGCGEFNPVMLFSKAEERKFAQSKEKQFRNEENEVNRRVMALLFRPGSIVPPSKWPCPRASEGSVGCKKRFWSDGESRRSLQLETERRLYDKTRDTFACRFYQRLVAASPCERTDPLVKISLRLFDVHHEPMSNASYTLAVGGLEFKGVTNPDGFLTHLVPAGMRRGKLILKNWTAEIEIKPETPIDSKLGQQDRLRNLGYCSEPGDDEEHKHALMRFQCANSEEFDGDFSGSTRSKLNRVHGS